MIQTETEESVEIYAVLIEEDELALIAGGGGVYIDPNGGR